MHVQLPTESQSLRPLLVDVLVAAQLLDVCPRTLDNLVAKGQLQKVKIGRATKFRLRDLEALVGLDSPPGVHQ